MANKGNETLKEKKAKIIAEIQSIVGNKKLVYSTAYVEACKYNPPSIGEGFRPMCGLTKKYLYCPCRVVDTVDEITGDSGVRILRYKLNNQTSTTDKVELERMLYEDIRKLLDDIKYYLWWEANVRYRMLHAQMAECEKYIKLFDRIKKP